jgi:hypothetical protein
VLIQDHIGRPIIVRCIPTAATRRAALARDAFGECLVTARARFLFRGTTVSIVARKLRREHRRAGQYVEQNRKHCRDLKKSSHFVSPFVLSPDDVAQRRRRDFNDPTYYFGHSNRCARWIGSPRRMAVPVREHDSGAVNLHRSADLVGWASQVLINL